jgi:hypothetical protein
MGGVSAFVDFRHTAAEIAVRHIPCPADAQTEKPGGSGFGACIPALEPLLLLQGIFSFASR